MKAITSPCQVHKDIALKQILLKILLVLINIQKQGHKMRISLIFGVFLVQHIKAGDVSNEEVAARQFMTELNKEMGIDRNKVALANWDYASNLTAENLQKKLALSTELAKRVKTRWLEVIKYNWRDFKDYELRRLYQKHSILGPAALPEKKYKVLNKLIGDMQAIYSKAKICDYNDRDKCNLGLEPEMTEIVATSRNPDELKHVWVQWRNASGRRVRDLFKKYVELSNEAARLNNFTDNAEFWLEDYDDPKFRQIIENLWQQLRPLYLQIHAYVRFQLRKLYGDIVSEKGPIPAHLLGNMWSQTWSNIGELSIPYKGVEDEDLTKELIEQNYTATKIFKTAEDFFKSINLTEMPPSFWEKSILEKPKDREIICHASAWDFHDGKDFRIKQCTKINKEDFITAHHEMGHVEYYLQYKHQPLPFQQGANDGFHEAVGDLISLSVRSTKHLRKIGLRHSKEDNPQTVLNNLYKTGLDKITFLPFGYLMDLWRWDVFSGKTTSENYNCKWWELREKYQGIEPPVDRSEEDFDPGAKYHIVANVPYLRYFISFVIQFQFHRAVCQKAGQYEPNNPLKPLHECDIYQNKEAGNALKNMLRMGSSRPWPDAMEALTGQRTMDASGLLEYFKPLQLWLEQENKKNNVFIGWEKSKRVCSVSPKCRNQE